ncbi:tripartite tricarboxylate transporter substrate-binding protein [Bradyrhizobium sp. GCM10027634]|uniref:tripartite tricarboxylate transporter substrate-binding protein n=1 Tax=unclassified Bradyrhizobium TaxID=2631580 RepID=UPI001FEF4091|nr:MULTISPECIES: tripartite tricarboxylate transporter substrate-binding protein [unclassified Bradyrhizobium]MDN5005721.1 tripartite tricarboxylate transporter substrate-binding protein [Bradyrhizobium sp. WYCCWR 12677]
MSTSLGQAFLIDNRPGSGGNIGTAAAAHVAPDGYMLLMSATTLVNSIALSPISASRLRMPPQTCRR